LTDSAEILYSSSSSAHSCGWNTSRFRYPPNPTKPISAQFSQWRLPFASFSRGTVLETRQPSLVFRPQLYSVSRKVARVSLRMQEPFKN
jgi:hypothetical protein